MSHAIELFVGRPGPIFKAREGVVAAKIFPLPQGFAALPVTPDVLGALRKYVGRGAIPRQRIWKPLHFEGAWRFDDQAIHVFGAWLSGSGPVAYIETNYFGGGGDQGAIVWIGRRRAYGPKRDGSNVVSEALARLGVQRDGLQDEFDALGLGTYRSPADFARGQRE